jgi:hypothetical protein
MNLRVHALVVAVYLAGLALPALGQQPATPCAPCRETPKVCVPAPDKKTKVRVVYSYKTEEYCLPKCRFSLFGKKDACDSCLECGKPRYRNVLLKRFVEEECPVMTCKPAAAPCGPVCAPACAATTPR